MNLKVLNNVFFCYHIFSTATSTATCMSFYILSLLCLMKMNRAIKKNVFLKHILHFYNDLNVLEIGFL